MRMTFVVLAVWNLRITPSKVLARILLVRGGAVAGLGHLEEEQQQEDRARGGDKRSAHEDPSEELAARRITVPPELGEVAEEERDNAA
jgi:hypothetical protein